MEAPEVKERAFAFPLTSPSCPRGPYRFIDREHMIVTYRTDSSALELAVPEPLEAGDSLVRLEFMRMGGSTGFGRYSGAAQHVPVHFGAQAGAYTHAMFLDVHAPISGGRELWGFPQKLAAPRLAVAHDVLLGTLDYGPERVATATMGYKQGSVWATAVYSAAVTTYRSPAKQQFAMALAPEIIEVIRQREAEIERLRDHGLPPFGSPGYLAAFMASKSKRTAKFEEERLLWQEIDRSVLPHLLTAYMAGSPLDRQEIRDLLNDNSKFAWGLGWAGREGPPAAKQTATADDLRRRLLLFTMKDGLKDWRDETVTLDDFSATAQRSGIDIEPLLIEAADLASNQPRGDRASTRATLLERVRKLRRQS